MKDAAQQLLLATTIKEAIDDYIDIECPHCHYLLEIPSLDDIKEWLEENEQ